MEIPFVVKPNITEKERENFAMRFGKSHGFDCSIRENVWRRHQTEENADVSGWNEGDRRIRLVHFRDRYGICNNNFCLIENYLRIHLSLPIKEIEEYVDVLQNTSARYEIEPDGDYSRLDIFYGIEPTEDMLDKPWKIFKTGIRKRFSAGSPTKITPNELQRFFPAHVELGCGPSTEAGIPALNYFHKIFSISKNGGFVFKKEDDTLVESLKDPKSWYEKTTYMQRKCLESEPTPFYFKIKQLIEKGDIIGPVFNNNFDGLIKSTEVEEICLRKWDETGIYPKYPFNESAKSLIVVGSHADRRGCQKSAREAGLKIVFVDPEGYHTNDGFVSYPLEAPQNEDFIINMSATEAFKLC